MNKDVIYIEPSDDITDVVTKISGSKERIVALVPPKNSNVLRSAINVKLIARAENSAEKTVVLVTSDPGTLRLAAASKLHVTKDLNSNPYIPDTAEIKPTTPEETEPEPSLVENLDDDEDAWIDKISGDDSSPKASKTAQDAKSVKNAKKGAKSSEAPEKADSEAKDDEEADKDAKTAEKEAKKAAKKAAKSDKKGPIGWILNHKKLAIALCVLLIALIGGGVWAFAIAPAVAVDVKVTTKQASFSDNISFTTTLADEDIDAGVFYLEEKTLDEKTSADFTATGSKNVGEKATGKLYIYYYFSDSGTVAINQGSTFTYNGLAFTADEDTTLSVTLGGEDESVKSVRSKCENGADAMKTSGDTVTFNCLKTAEISITAAGAGSNYNGIYADSGWQSTSGIGARSASTTSGGTDKTVTVVQQSDIESAISGANVASESEMKEKLLASLDDDDLAIDSSFSVSRGEVTSDPAVDAEADKGTVSFTTTAKIYVVDETKIEKYIETAVDLPENERIYDLGSPFIESFGQGSSGYVGKLKTSYYYGARTTESEIMDIVKGKKIGDAKTELQSKIENSTVTITGSYPWVSSVPDDSNRISITVENDAPASANVDNSSENETNDSENNN